MSVAPSMWTPSAEAMLTRLVAASFTNEQIAMVLGSTASAVQTKASKAKLREKVMPSQRDAVARHFDAGSPVNRIVSRTGLSAFTVNRVLIEIGRIPAPDLDPEIEALRASVGEIDRSLAFVERPAGVIDAIVNGIEEGRTQRQIAEAAGVGISTVHRVMRERGIGDIKPRAKTNFAARRDELQRMVNEGMSAHMIATRMGHDHRTIADAIERLGIRRERTAA